ncbi:MAG: Hypothetical protein AJITA_00886 [Acetilactobacillus jinshanensis]
MPHKTYYTYGLHEPRLIPAKTPMGAILMIQMMILNTLIFVTEMI